MPGHEADVEAFREQEQADALASSFSNAGEAGRERLARIMDLLPCYVALMDRSHRFLFYNKAFTDFFGRPGKGLCHAVLRGQKKACAFCPPLAALERGEQTVMDWVHAEQKHAFRTYSYPFIEEGKEPLVLKVGFDATDSLRVQQALELSEQSYRAITDNISIGVALLDPSLRVKAGNMRLSQWFAEGFRLNRAVCDLLQCPSWSEDAAHDPRTDPACGHCAFHASLLDGASHEMELAVNFTDRADRMVRLVACPVKSGKRGTRKDDVRAMILMMEDITTRLRVNQQLQRARKLEAMTTLAGGIAHEINQPLSALHLYASGLQMLLEKDDRPSVDTIQERLVLIMYEADKIRSIIAHMRTLVMREGSVPLHAVSLEKSLGAVVGLMKNQYSARGVDIVLDIAPGLPPVRANDVQLEQVLMNLLANAMHAMDSIPGGSCGSLPHDPQEDGQASASGKGCSGFLVQIRATLNDCGDRVRLEIADSGPGLPPGGEQIFNPFYTTKERHEGMGLGLSIVHGLVSLWGGEISARAHHPELGGAVFYVDLHPYASDTAGSPSEGGQHADREQYDEELSPITAIKERRS